MKKYLQPELIIDEIKKVSIMDASVGNDVDMDMGEEEDDA